MRNKKKNIQPVFNQSDNAKDTNFFSLTSTGGTAQQLRALLDPNENDPNQPWNTIFETDANGNVVSAIESCRTACTKYNSDRTDTYCNPR